MGIFSFIDRLLEDIATGFVQISGNGFDPDGSRLPSFAPPKPPPTAKVPKKEAEKDKGGFWVGFDGQNIYSEGSNTVDLEDFESYGLTEREYGEMLAYNPPLRDLALASKVKRAKLDGYTAKEMAQRFGAKEQEIKHYSAAFYRAATR